ncbi:MAG: tetratricopeptide repeat protein, partial [Betaproteobacteria bacterium]
MNTIITRILITGALLFATSAFAAGALSEPERSPDKLDGVRAQIAAKNFPGAIDELKRLNDTGDADWNNLMGYSLRKGPTPDFAGAEKFYDEALRIDPKHRGALEYSGELYVQTGDLAKAEQRLAALDKACRFGCSEYSDLKKAIAQYKAGSGTTSSG